MTETECHHVMTEGRGGTADHPGTTDPHPETHGGTESLAVTEDLTTEIYAWIRKKWAGYRRETGREAYRQGMIEGAGAGDQEVCTHMIFSGFLIFYLALQYQHC